MSIYHNDIERARAGARAKLEVMHKNLNLFDSVPRVGAKYKNVVLQTFRRPTEELTAGQCSYISEVIYEAFMKAYTGIGCPSVYKHNFNKK